LQYEMFYAGEAPVIKAKEFRTYDWATAEALVDQCLESYDLNGSTAGQIG
jgi:hypothetical protein